MNNHVIRGEMQFGEHLVDRFLTDKQKITVEAEIPIIRAVDFKPTAFIGENLAMASVKKDVKRQGTVHYFLDDYRLNGTFKKIWDGACAKHVAPCYWDDSKDGEDYRAKKEQAFDEYIGKLKQFEAVCSPDYSVYANFCNPTNLHSVWRNRVIGCILQEEGLTVIPTVTWSTMRTYEYAFCGLEKHGTYAISANGCFDHDKEAREASLCIFRNGLIEMEKRLEPTRIIVHGSKELPDADYGKADVMFFRSVISDEANYRLYKKAKAEAVLTEEDIDISRGESAEFVAASA